MGTGIRALQRGAVDDCQGDRDPKAEAAGTPISAADLFSRNIWLTYVRQDASPWVQTLLAKIVAVMVAGLALLFILAINTTFILNFQLLGGVWILQTFPAIVFGLYTRRFHRWALLAGWVAGIVTGTLMAWANAFATSVYTVSLGPLQFSAYAGLIALAVNILVLLVAQPVCQALHLPAGTDETVSDDYEAEPEPARRREPARAG